MDPRGQHAHELRRTIESSLSRALDPGAVLPLLHRLSRVAAEGSEESVFAHRHLAELLVERNPWRAALFARRVLSRLPDDDRGWATLALCQTLLGNYRYAVTAYHRAIASAPKNPWYAHNLGHLLDVALGQPSVAVEWLELAWRGAAQSGEVAASYAHALARAGRLSDARRVLSRAVRRSPSRELSALMRWVDAGAPGDEVHPVPRAAPIGALTAGTPAPPAGKGRAASRARPPMGALDATLQRGLGSLPLDGRQRAMARAVARDTYARLDRPSGARAAATTHAMAAAVAYAIVFVDHVPLTQAEVASCFRVSVAGMRGRFAELRALLDLVPGDARYATPHARRKHR